MSDSADPIAVDVTATSDLPKGLTWGWIIRRLAISLLVFWLVTTMIFLATQALPSDPAQAILGRATPAQLDALRHELGIDRPAIDQYLGWLEGVVSGNFGTSLSTREPVTSVVAGPIVNSLVLLLLTAAIAIPAGIGLGFWAAARRDSFGDRAAMAITVGLTAFPEFVVGVVLVMLFSTTVLDILPAVTTFGDASPFSHPSELILPVATLVIVSFPYILRLSRAAMIEALTSEYVMMARLKGMPRHIVVWRHAARNALVAPVQASSVILIYLLSGVVVVEYIFAYPGLGTTLTQAVGVRDLPTIQGTVLCIVVGVVVFNLIADVLTVLFTPKLRAPVS